MNKPRSGELPELEAHLGYWLRRVSNQVSGAFAQALQARQVSVAEWVCLRHIYGQENITPGELAGLLDMTRGAISKVLDKLERKTWVSRTISPEDSRVQLLALTPEGRRILPELAEIADSNDHRYFDCLSEDEQTLLRQLLEKLTRTHQWNHTPVD